MRCFPKEAEQATSGKKTIQTALQEALLKRSDYTHSVFDHGTGEIADYISFRSEGSFIKAELFHCKAMKGAQYNNSVIDVYEVAQQAIKSTVWIKTKTTLLTKIQSRVKSGNSKKFIRGDIRSLRTLLQSQKAILKLEIDGRSRVFLVDIPINFSIMGLWISPQGKPIYEGNCLSART